MSGGASRRHSSFGFYVLSKTYIAIEVKDMPAFCVIIGVNGTGKSSFFDIFGVLRDALTNNISQAL
jgi:predicted ATPase